MHGKLTAILPATALLACVAASAEDGSRPHGDPTGARFDSVNTTTAAWPAAGTSANADRLAYLKSASPCYGAPGCNRASPGFTAGGASVERDYIDSLDLGTYGSMNFKFTGNRVKLKVRF